uniref:Uncharacterized protein n=1 Tax=Oryza brachyantha TaxID=4533 RepID=J3L073_ORYBR
MDVNGALVNWSCTANSPGLHACRDATLGQYFTNSKLISSYLGSYYYYPKFYIMYLSLTFHEAGITCTLSLSSLLKQQI